jgi:radical SAM protein with 4Fe4S-binding SPASM domain
VDEFIGRVRPYIYVRTQDNLLIKRPNQVQKLNPQGARLLSILLRGTPIRRLLEKVGRDPEKVRDIALFLFDVKRYLEGTLNEFNRTAAVDIEPFQMRFSELPIISEIALTYRCNLRCSFCYAGCNCTRKTSEDRSEMSTSEVKEILNRLFNQAKVPSVSFTGGEATIRKDLPDLVEHASSLGMRVNLITNGTLVSPGLADKLAASGLASAQISLEGTKAETHETLTRIPGSFGRAVAAVRHLQRAGVRVHTNTTINRENADECVSMPGLVKNVLGTKRFSMNLLIPAGSAVQTDELLVRYHEVGALLQRIIEASRNEEVEFMWYSPTPMCLFNPVAHQLGNKGCSACDGLISVAPDGSVLPCSSYDDPVGNLLTQNVEEIWNSEKARWYRDKLFAYDLCRTSCEEFEVCHGACPLYWRHVGFGELKKHKPAARSEETPSYAVSGC